ncbi:hypothetical protein BDV93DRAFT_527642 [Ceratobasidium sp. AG-I]|nr:hypothetical protein BDV93DRAFT_527642 [Ceratobasidium sp. AG-I]
MEGSPCAGALLTHLSDFKYLLATTTLTLCTLYYPGLEPLPQQTMSCPLDSRLL